jgi:hypothetical protein
MVIHIYILIIIIVTVDSVDSVDSYFPFFQKIKIFIFKILFSNFLKRFKNNYPPPHSTYSI